MKFQALQELKHSVEFSTFDLNAVPEYLYIPEQFRFKFFEANVGTEIFKRWLHFDNIKEFEKLVDIKKYEEQVEFITAIIKSSYFSQPKVFPKLYDKSSMDMKFNPKAKPYVETGTEFVMAFVDDIHLYDYIYLADKYNYGLKFKLLEYVELEPMLEEVRLFVVADEVRLSTQYCVQQQIDDGLVKPIQKERIDKAIDFYNTCIKNYTTMPNFVADIGFKKSDGNPVLVEFNPLFKSHPCMLEI